VIVTEQDQETERSDRADLADVRASIERAVADINRVVARHRLTLSGVDIATLECVLADMRALRIDADAFGRRVGVQP
jgi:asparagine synthetase A